MRQSQNRDSTVLEEKNKYWNIFFCSDVKIAIVEPKDVQEPQEGEQIQGKKAPRDQWSKDIEFLLASIGYCVGVGNIWR